MYILGLLNSYVADLYIEFLPRMRHRFGDNSGFCLFCLSAVVSQVVSEVVANVDELITDEPTATSTIIKNNSESLIKTKLSQLIKLTKKIIKGWS